MTEQGLRQALIDACRKMNGLGINQGKSGNASIRLPDGSGLLVTPSSLAYEAMQPADIVALDWDGTPTGPRLPSSEWRFHLDIMKARPDAGAILHTHSIFATTLACLGKGIPAFHYMVAVAGAADIRCAPYATFGTQALSDHAVAALEGRKACLLGNHGMICLEASIGQALDLAVEVETLAAQYWRALQIGQPNLLSDAEMAAVLERFGRMRYGQSPE
ncbi:MAG: class II aldolase/adducin family protein [Alphaproteobacteria bacterium]|nr:class II aldolase/adducin family protein [Alphaproteobacteria bacterium]MBU0796683.1 class II aldolase/adducin family protein [Alphaproteobacteria bacterium]MBU0888232.1 class II aldolase/adducin family protein [Alphaproteobacteria bacterium]MBU1811433.1 class II aldolase/adducin family protein [Alphaproteobacteria bacterium]